MTDLLGDAGWWHHSLLIERFNGDDAYGDEFDTGETVVGHYSDKTEYSGGQVIAAGRFAFPIGVAYVPVQSKVTLPAEFGTAPDGSPRVHRVVRSDVADGGGQPTPDHQTIGLL